MYHTNRVRYRFLNTRLEELYRTGKHKKYRLDKVVIIDFVSVVDVIIAAQDINDFWRQPGLYFKKLQGYKCRYSFRLGKKYRLEVEIDWENEEKTVGIVGIDEISKHYE